MCDKKSDIKNNDYITTVKLKNKYASSNF